MPGTKRTTSGTPKGKKATETGFDRFREKKKQENKSMAAKAIKAEWESLPEVEKQKFELEVSQTNPQESENMEEVEKMPAQHSSTSVEADNMETESESKRRMSTESGVTEGEASIAPEEVAADKTSEEMKKSDNAPRAKKGKIERHDSKEYGDTDKRERVTRSRKIPISMD